MQSRINLFKQLRAYYSFVFNENKNITPSHTSLYMFLLNQNNRANWVEWFKCPADTAMYGALINSNKTYYKILNELVDFGLIELQKGINNYKAPKIKIVILNYENDMEKPEIQIPELESSSVLNTRLLTPLLTQLHTLLPTLIDKHNTNLQLTLKLTKKKREDKSSLYTKIIDIYSLWFFNKFKTKIQFDGSDGKAVKKIISYLESNEAGDENVIKNFTVVLNNYDQWDKFYKKQTRIRQIESNLSNIITSFKNGNEKFSEESINAAYERFGK